MSLHSYTRVLLHIIWGTLKREKILSNVRIRKNVASYLKKYAYKNKIYLENIYVNAEHVHLLVDLPTHITLEEMLQRFKGSSSHWINQNNLVRGKFSWGRGYAVFSVSHSNLLIVNKYIFNQNEHHQKNTFKEEYEVLIKKHQLIFSKSFD